jgi:hypothetical protein
VAASPVRSSGFLTYALVYALVADSAVYVKAAHFLDEGMRTELRIENCARCADACFELAIHLAADFADLKETTLRTRAVTGPVETAWDATRQEHGRRACGRARSAGRTC